MRERNNHTKARRTQRLKVIFFKYTFAALCLCVSSLVYAQSNEAHRRATIRFGTETEIASLIQALRNENADYLDDELITLVNESSNTAILTGIFGFFGEREKGGLEDRALRIITERDHEANAVVLASIDYLGRLSVGEAVPVLMELLNTEERRFMNNAFRALGRVSSANSEQAEEAAEFLIDFYENRDPGNDNRRDVILAMGSTRSHKTIPVLSEIATNNDERVPLRMAALEALSRVGSEEGLSAIINCVSAGDPNVRSAAVAALGPFSGDNVDRAILDAFRDDYYRTRIAAAQASRERKLVAAVPFLQFRAERDDVPNVRDEAIRALGAIANDEAVEVLENLFSQRNNSDRIRILCAQMLMSISGQRYFSRIVIELDDAQARNQTALFNGLLRITGEAIVEGDRAEVERIARRFIQSGTLIERLYGLDMAANNNLRSLETEIRQMAAERNETVSRRARRTAERLGIEISEES